MTQVVDFYFRKKLLKQEFEINENFSINLIKSLRTLSNTSLVSTKYENENDNLKYFIGRELSLGLTCGRGQMKEVFEVRNYPRFECWKCNFNLYNVCYLA